MNGPDNQPDRTDDTEPARLFGVPFAWILPITLALLGALICGVVSFLGAYWDVDVSRLSFGDALSRVLILAAGPIIGALGGIALGILVANLVYDYAPIWWLVYLPGIASYFAIGFFLKLWDLEMATGKVHDKLKIGLAILPVMGLVWAVSLYRRQVPIKTSCEVTLTTYALAVVFIFFFGFPNI